MDFNVNKAISILVEKLEGWLSTLTAMLPNFVVAIFVLILFAILSKFFRSLAKKVLNRFSNQKVLNSLVATLVRFSILIIGIIISLNILKLDQTVTSLLAGAGIIGLALGFAFQDIIANFFSGVFLIIKQPIKVGDIIQFQDYLGKVDSIDLRITTVRTFQGLHVLIPNKEIYQNILTNFTQTHERRIDLEVGISYGDDLEKVKKITLDTVNSFSFLLKEKDINFYYTEFGSSSINFKVMFWIDYPDHPGYLEARSEAIIAIKKTFDDNNITIPFPIRTLDFGIKGGKELHQQIEKSKFVVSENSKPS